jgi:ribose transport system permease protein
VTAPGTGERGPEPDDAEDPRTVAKASFAARWLASGGTWVLLLDIALVIVFTVVSGNHVFWSLQDFQALMLDGTETLLLALGIAMFLGAGAIDISVGSNLVLSSVVGAEVIIHVAGKPSAAGNYPHLAGTLLLGLVVCLAAGVVYGAVNGVIIAYFRVNSLIATLGTAGVGTGIALLITNGNDLSGVPTAIQGDFGLATAGPVPLPALVALAAAVALWVVLRTTRYGLRTLAIGSLRLAAERAGLHVSRHIFSLAVLCGLLAGMAGFVDLSHYASTTVNGHTNDALAAITAVVIGGTRLEGGKISLLGTLWGTGLSVVLQGGLVVIGVAPFWQLIVVGAVLIAAVCLDRVRLRRRAAR